MISIIIPFYNTESYLDQCLNSVLEQTYTDFEALMIDDGSTDGSRAIAESYVSRDNRFKLLGREHIGFPRAKNLGLDNAQGDYIAFLDSDDFLDSHYLEYLHRGITENDADICCCRYNVFNDGEEPPVRPINGYVCVDYHHKMQQIFEKYGALFLWNKLYKKELFNNLRHEDVISLSDTIIIYKVFDKAQKVVNIYPFLYNYRKHEDSMSHLAKQTEGYWAFRYNVFLDAYIFIYERYPKERKYIKNRFEHTVANITPHLTQKEIKSFEADSRVQTLRADLVEETNEGN